MVRKFVFFALFVSSFSAVAETSRMTAAHLRLFNGSVADAIATLGCGGMQTPIAVTSRGVADVPDSLLDGCRNAAGLAELTLEHDPAVVALETSNYAEGDEQRLLTHVHPTDECAATAVIQAPLNGCKSARQP